MRYYFLDLDLEHWGPHDESRCTVMNHLVDSCMCINCITPHEEIHVVYKDTVIGDVQRTNNRRDVNDCKANQFYFLS